MLEIISVFSGGEMIDIHLSNGNILMLDCALLLRQPGFEELAEDGRIYYPHAKKNLIFWKGGPEISLKAIMELVSATPETEDINNYSEENI